MSAVQSAWGTAIRGGFRLLYREMAWSYDAVSHVVSLGRWKSWRQACIPFLAGPRILELGCGPGHLQVELSARGHAAVGLDASPQMVRTATVNLHRAGYPPRIVRGLGQSLPFADGRFNSVVATFPTPYIADPATLAEIMRVLTPNGRLVVVLEAELTEGVPLRRLIDLAYRITGQRAEPAAEGPPRWSDVLCDQVSAAGMRCEVHEITLADSRVTLVVARGVGNS